MDYQYLIFAHLDEPARFLTLTFDEVFIVASGLLMLIGSNQKIIIAALGAALIGALRYLKKGGGPKALVKLAYWYLPSFIMQFFLPKLPASYQRVWQA